MTKMEQFFYQLLNFFAPALAVEEIPYVVEDKKLDAFVIGLRFIQVSLVVFICYTILKVIEFLLELLARNFTSDIPLVYIALPLLILIEIGLSTLDVTKINNLMLFISRAVVKFGLFYGIDRVMIALF
ncbi:MAG: hypothetical protein AAF632_15840 [Bacteroidota bacterium]